MALVSAHCSPSLTPALTHGKKSARNPCTRSAAGVGDVHRLELAQLAGWTLRKAWNSAPLALSNTVGGDRRRAVAPHRVHHDPDAPAARAVGQREGDEARGGEGEALLALARRGGVHVLGGGLVDPVSGGDRCALRRGGGARPASAAGGAGDEASDHRVLVGSGSSAALRTRSGRPRWSSRKPSSVPGTRAPGMVICLGWPSPATSSSLPAACPVGVGHTSPLIWPCSDWGLPCHRRCRRRGGLLPHRFTLTRRLPGGRSVLCGPVRRLSAPRRYLAVYPVELGLSSERLAAPATITLDQRGEYNGDRDEGGRRRGRG